MKAPRRLRLRVAPTAAATTDARYLSVMLDLGCIAEPTRFWNPSGAGETVAERPSFAFDRQRLIRLTAALAPAYLRIGGTEADRVFYALDESSPPPRSPPPPYGSVLTASHLDAIGAFARATGFDVCFALNAGWGARTADGVWDGTQAAALMQHVAARGTGERRIPITVYELGNEVRAALAPPPPPNQLLPTVRRWIPTKRHATDDGTLCALARRAHPCAAKRVAALPLQPPRAA